MQQLPIKGLLRLTRGEPLGLNEAKTKSFKKRAFVYWFGASMKNSLENSRRATAFWGPHWGFFGQNLGQKLSLDCEGQ